MAIRNNWRYFLHEILARKYFQRDEKFAPHVYANGPGGKNVRDGRHHEHSNLSDVQRMFQRRRSVALSGSITREPEDDRYRNKNWNIS